MLENRRCRYWLARHTVWYWLENGASDPTPYSYTFNNQKDAVVWAQAMTKNTPVELRWIKVLNASDTTIMCWHWENPKPIPPPHISEPVIEPLTLWQKIRKHTSSKEYNYAS